MVSKNRLKDIILEQREEVKETFQKERIIKREIISEVGKYLVAPNILTILGVRRCGKSTFSWQIFENKKFAYINFDDERLAFVKTEDLNKILEVFYELYGKDLEYIVLDEIQNVNKWELFTNRLRRTKKVIITGSNSKLLSGELATVLTGRYIDFTLFPFSFREFLDYKEKKFKEITTKERGEIFKELNEFLEVGGFPEVHKFGKRILIRIYESIITKDVIKRLEIRKEIELLKLSEFLLSNFSKEFSYKSLKHITNVKHISTLSKWVKALCEVYLLFVIERFSFKLKKPIYAPKKVYCIDNGLITSIGFRISENKGRLMENLVAIELLRRKSYWHNNWEVNYWKDYQQREVDFVIKEGLKVKQLIQVTYASSKDEIEQRELRSLVKASEVLNCKDLLVITWDYENEEEFKGKKIKFLPLWKWLLGI